MRPVRERMSGPGHRQGQSCEGEQRRLHLLYALRLCLSSFRKENKQSDARRRQHHAEESMRGTERVRIVSLMHRGPARGVG